jgi:hypothetical protein
MSELEELLKALEMVKRRRAVLQRQLDELDEIITTLPKLVTILRDTRPSDNEVSEPYLSVYSKVVNLLEEEDRTYSINEIFEEWARRDDPIQGKNPKNALRTALSEAVKKGRIQRIAEGEYMANIWPPRVKAVVPQSWTVESMVSAAVPLLKKAT